MSDDPVADNLDIISQMVEQQNFIPPATTLLALRRINGAVARVIAKYNAFVDDEGNAIAKKNDRA